MIIAALILLPAAFAIAVWPMRRVRAIASPLATVVFALEIVLALFAVRSDSLLFMGRTLALDATGALALILSAGMMAILMIAAGTLDVPTVSWSAILGIFAVLALATVIQEMTLSALLVTLASISLVALVPSGTRSSGATALRTMAVLLLGALPLIFAAWAAQQAGGKDTVAVAAGVSGFCVLLGSGILFGLLPFGAWLPPLFRHSNFVAVAALAILPASMLMLRIPAFSGSVLEGGSIPTVLLWGGVLTAIVASAISLLHRRFALVVAYAAIADMGIAAVGLAMAPTNTTALLWFLAMRGLALVILCIGCQVLQDCFGSDDAKRLIGASRRAPITLASMALAGLSLAGLPPMVGFSNRLQLLRQLQSLPAAWLWALALCGLGPGWAVMRLVIASWGTAAPPGSRQEPRGLAALLMVLSMALLVLGIVPSLGQQLLLFAA